MENNEQEMSFEELINNSMKEIKIGQIVTGTVIEITRNKEVFIDIGYKSDGIIPLNEYSYDQNADPSVELKIGDKISAEVLRLNDGIGNVLLSYKKLKDKDNRVIFEQKVNNKETFEEKISEVIDKGFIVNYNGIRIFIPISLSGITRDEDIKTYNGKLIKFKVIEYDPARRKIVGSVKEVTEEQKQKTLKDFWDNAKEGNIYDGTVVSISSYGAFIDIGGIQGLLHISEISWSRSAVASEILTVGQTIKVSIKTLDRQEQKISLRYEEKGPNPWDSVEEKYKVGDIVTVKIVKLMPFGAFAEIEPGVEGLIHISQITEERIAKPEDKLQLEQKVNAKIIELNKENKKIELSIKEVEGTTKEYQEEE